MSFSGIPTRTNGTRILRSWFNDLATAGSTVESDYVSKTQASAMAGKLTTNGGQDCDGALTYAAVVDSATTGSDQSITPTDIHIKLTHASLVSINNIASPASGKIHVLTNGKSSGTIVLKNDAGGTAANRIITGTAADLTLANGASVILIYDNNSTRWRVVGGSGGGGSAWTESSQQALTASGTITITTSDPFQSFVVAGNGAAVTLSTTPFGTSPPSASTTIQLIGNSDSNTISITANDATNGCTGNFSTITLAKYEVATFQYSPTLTRYVYVS